MIKKLELSTILLIITNIITIFIAVFQKWNFVPLLLIFWFQGTVIAIFTYIQIKHAKNYDLSNIKINDAPVEETEFNKQFVNTFLFIGYMIFNFVYLLFICVFLKPHIDMYLIFSAALFVVTHCVTYRIHYDENEKIEVGTKLGVLFLRTYPIHIIICVGTYLGVTGTLILFLILKTIIDVATHCWKHKTDVPDYITKYL